jgi:hypothetical protein
MASLIALHTHTSRSLLWPHDSGEPVKACVLLDVAPAAADPSIQYAQTTACSQESDWIEFGHKAAVDHLRLACTSHATPN